MYPTLDISMHLSICCLNVSLMMMIFIIFKWVLISLSMNPVLTELRSLPCSLLS